MPTVSVVELDKELNEVENTCKSFEISEGSVIFDAIDDQGLKLPHGCLAGSCGSCKIIVLEGHDTLQKISFVENNTVEAVIKTLSEKEGVPLTTDHHMRLSCRARIGDKPVKIGLLK